LTLGNMFKVVYFINIFVSLLCKIIVIHRLSAEISKNETPYMYIL